MHQEKLQLIATSKVEPEVMVTWLQMWNSSSENRRSLKFLDPVSDKTLGVWLDKAVFWSQVQTFTTSSSLQVKFSTSHFGNLLHFNFISMQLSAHAQASFDSIVAEHSITFTEVDPKPPSLKEYIETSRITHWDTAYSKILFSGGKIKKSHTWDQQIGAELAMKRLLYRSKFLYIYFFFGNVNHLCSLSSNSIRLQIMYTIALRLFCKLK